ncbi:MAG: threonylcarbamoyl-AMP synthase [Pyrinomonadaceae bacterium]|nr:threonylcarbamoyl-AMP synthase [Pyrinomonadaceae bacterium]
MSEREKPAHRILPDTEATREHARRIVEAGGVVAFRTDTFYGLGADPFNPTGVSRINRLKEREGRKPVLVVISDSEVAERFMAEKAALFDELTNHYWPGALTVIVKARSSVPDGITAGSGTIGLRLPGDEDVRAFIRTCGGALTATSANLAGEPPARTAAEVAHYFPTELDLIIDAGDARTDKPSTVIDASPPHPRLIREGEIPRQDLERTLSALGVELK